MRVPQRGRAVLRQLSAHDATRTFRAGDFLLTASSGGLARLQGWATGCELNHAAVIIDPLGSVVEANPLFSRNSRPFRLTTISEYLRAGKPCWIGYVELREGTRQDVAAYSGHLLSVGSASSTHPLSSRVWLALHTLFGVAPRYWTSRVRQLAGAHRFLDNHALVPREAHCFSSGELVARALERGGFIWACDAAYVTPADLFASFHHIDADLEPVRHDTRRKMNFRRATLSPTQPSARFATYGVRGANALSEEPQELDAPPAGIQALAHVGVLMAASLALIGLLEEVIKLAAREL
jgi:hypothetical protein